MTTRPELQLGPHLWRGLSAVALFVLLAVVFLRAGFGEPATFEGLLAMEGVDSITSVIGHAMFQTGHESLAETGTETFIAAFIIVAVVLDAALEGAVMLARREEGGVVVSALRAIGGEE